VTNNNKDKEKGDVRAVAYTISQPAKNSNWVKLK